MKCDGQKKEHCCWLTGIKCPFVLEGADAPEGREHACGLVVRYGNWKEAMESEEYSDTVRPLWNDSGLPEGLDCSNWPQRILESDEGLEPGPWACCFYEEDD